MWCYAARFLLGGAFVVDALGVVVGRVGEFDVVFELMFVLGCFFEV